MRQGHTGPAGCLCLHHQRAAVCLQATKGISGTAAADRGLAAQPCPAVSAHLLLPQQVHQLQILLAQGLNLLQAGGNREERRETRSRQ